MWVNCRSKFSLAVVSCLAIVTSIAGCGGGGGGSSPGGPGGGSTGGTSPTVTTFHVDVTSGQVTVNNPSAQTGKFSAHAVFSGSSVGFNSSQLLDQGGLKSLNVTVTNNWGLPIGVAPGGTSGFKVIFSPFSNDTAFGDIRSKSTVSAFAGTGSAGAADGPAAAASFTGPTGTATDFAGTVYVADNTLKKIRKIANGFVSTINTPVSLTSPFGIAVDPVDSSLIVTALGGNAVKRILTDGRISTVAGTGTAGGGDGTGDIATLSGPAGVAVDRNGTIYVADFNGNKIRKIVLVGADPTNPSNYNVSTLAGSGIGGYADGIGSTATFNKPAGITVDAAGIVYVADSSNNRIRRIDPAGNVTTVAGAGSPTELDGNGNTATFNTPRGIVAVNGALIVSDEGGNKLRQITLKAGGTANPTLPYNWQVLTLAGTGVAGSNNGTGDIATFNAVKLISVDQSGNLYLPEFGTHKIRKLTPTNGSFPVGIATGSTSTEQVQLSNADGVLPNSGSPYITYPYVVQSGATSQARQWNFTIPNGVTAFDFTVTVEANTTALTPPTSTSGAGDPSGNVRTYAGAGSHLGFLNGTLATARFNGPEFIAVDAANNLYLSDEYNCAVRRIGANGIVSTIAGTGASGFGDGAGTTAQFSFPQGIAVSPDGSVVFVADTSNHRIRRISFVGGDVTNPGNWYVNTIAGTGTVGGNYSSLPGNTATFNAPTGLCMDAGGNLYMTEYVGNRIRRIRYTGGDPTNASNYYVDPIAGSSVSVSPAAGEVDATNGTSATFNHPNQIAVDNYDNLYVADSSNQRIRKITEDGAVTTFAGGVSGDTPSTGHVDGTGDIARFNGPSGIAVDSADEVFVTEQSGNYIRRIGQNGVVTTVAGTGSLGTSDGPGNTATFTNPAAVAADVFGNLYVGSVNDNSVRMIQRTITSGTQ